MKLVLILVVLLCFALVGTSLAALIRPEQAMEAVRAFEENPNLKFDSVELSYGLKPTERPEKNQYDLSISGDSDASDNWAVDADTGEIIYAHHYNAYPDVDSSDTPFGPLTQEQCRKIAEDFIHRNCSQFNTRNFKINGSGDWDECTWSFSWWEYLPNNARTLNYIELEVNPVSGKIVLYSTEMFHTYSDWTRMITPEQAIEAVRAFEGDSSLQFSEPYIDRSEYLSAWAQQDGYNIRLKTLDIDRNWNVDAFTREVVSAFYGDAYPPGDDTYTDDPVGSWTEEQCRQVADSFVHLHYSGFRDLNIEGEKNGYWAGNSWEFGWGETLSCGASTPNGVSVTINPADGRIMSYHSNRVAMPALPDPQLDERQAIETAARAAGIVNLHWNDEPMMTANPEGIFWTVEVGGEDAQNHGRLRLVTLDAVTGKAIEICTANGGSSPGVAALLDEQADNLIPIRQAIKNTPDSSVHWIPGTGAKLTIDKSTCIIRPGTAKVQWNEKSITLSKKPVIRNDRLMVPPSFIEQLRKDLE